MITTGTAVCYHKGMATVPLHWVLVRDQQHKLTAQAFLCTDLAVKPEKIFSGFIRRWQTEVTFEEMCVHLGMETQRQWSDRAIACTTPIIFAFYSIVALTARQLVRRSLWSEAIYGGSGHCGDMLKIPRAFRPADRNGLLRGIDGKG